MHDGAHRALVRHAAFDAFRHQLLGTGRGVLEVTVGRTLSLSHGAQRAHAAVGLVGTALEQLDLTRSFFGTGQHGADHHRGSAGSDGLGQVAGETDATVGNQRYAGTFQRGSHIGHGTDLRHADAGNDTGGADGARADTDLHAVCAGLSQSTGRVASGDVAADDLHLREVLLDPAHAVDHALGVAVSGVDDDHVNAGRYQCGNAVTGIGTGTDGSADAQAALLVLAGQRVGLGLLDVVDGHHALEGEGVVDDQYTLDTVLVQQGTHGVLVGAFGDGDQTLFGRHHFAHLGVQTALETYVTGGDDADQVAIGQHRYTGDVVLAGQLEQVAHGGVGVNGDRVGDHTGLELLDLAHFGSLLLDGHVLVDDADAAFLGHGNGQTGFGNGVHGGREQRNVQLDATGQTGFQADVFRQDLGITGDQENIVEGQCFLADTQHGGAPKREK